MKLFIKNSYLFLIFFIILICKDFFLSLDNNLPQININDLYFDTLQSNYSAFQKINNISLQSQYSYGKVALTNAYNFHSKITIKISDKVSENDLVINEKGLVGTIFKVYDSYALVNLLTNKKTLLQVKVNDCYGLLKYDQKLILSNVNNYCHVLVNDEVYISNLMGFTEKILIGKVNKIIYDDNKIANLYEISPEVNFNNLDYVIILSKGEK